MESRILVIGETCMDIFYYGRCDRLCPEAPAPVFNPIDCIKNPGMAMNVQKNIRALGYMCDINTNPNWQEITKTRYVHKNTNQMFIRVDQNDDRIERCDLSNINFSYYNVVIVSDYCKGFITEEDVTYITSQHPCVFLDTKKTLGSWCKDVKYIKINGYEYEKTKYNVSSEIREKLIVTLGPAGCLYQDKTYPVKSVEIKDVSGAGDTFIAGLVVKYIESQNIETSINFANECATIVVQKRGVSVI